MAATVFYCLEAKFDVFSYVLESLLITQIEYHQESIEIFLIGVDWCHRLTQACLTAELMELYKIHAVVSLIKLVLLIEKMGVNLATDLGFQLFVRFITEEMGVLLSRSH